MGQGLFAPRGSAPWMPEVLSPLLSRSPLLHHPCMFIIRPLRVRLADNGHVVDGLGFAKRHLPFPAHAHGRERVHQH